MHKLGFNWVFRVFFMRIVFLIKRCLAVLIAFHSMDGEQAVT